jgi:hypothetical protein
MKDEVSNLGYYIRNIITYTRQGTEIKATVVCACAYNERDKECIYNFGGETSCKKTTWKTKQELGR